MGRVFSSQPSQSAHLSDGTRDKALMQPGLYSAGIVSAGSANRRQPSVFAAKAGRAHSSSMPATEPAPVESSRYGKNYFLENCDGFAEFLGDGELPLRLARALHLAKLQPGERVVDLGCAA